MDQNTFLTTGYVLIADACTLPVEDARPGRRPSLTREELLTLALFGQWYRRRTRLLSVGNRASPGLFPHPPQPPPIPSPPAPLGE